MKPSELTLGIPYHNQPDYLHRALASVVTQTSNRWNLIVCDDSADGDAKAIVEKWSHPRIRYHRNPHAQGIVANWKKTIEQVETDLFSLFHADDELDPNYVAGMLSFAEKFPKASLLYCKVRVIDCHGEFTFSFPDWIKSFFEKSKGAAKILSGENGATSLLRGNFIFCPSLVYRRSQLPYELFDEKRSQVMDLDLYLRLLVTGKQIVGSTTPLYRYRRHAQSLTSKQTVSLKRFHEEISLYEEWSQRFSAHGWEKAARVAQQRQIIRLHLLYLLATDLVRLRGRDIVDKCRLLVAR